MLGYDMIRNCSYKIFIILLVISVFLISVFFIIIRKFDKINEVQIVSEQSDNNKNLNIYIKHIKDSPDYLKQNNSQTTVGMSDNDSYLIKLQDDDIQRVTRKLDAMEKIPVINWKKDLLSNMKNENINQTIKNIPNFDDTILAQSSLAQGYAHMIASAQNKYVMRLMRVRKLYAIGEENPNQIIPILKSFHKNSFAQWPKAVHELTEYYNEHEGYPKLSEPDAFHACSDYCLAATYLLAELGDYDSLPLLSKQYKIHDPWAPINHITSPVAPATTFYAMHRLVSSYPKDSLSKEDIKALDIYLEDARDLVPEPEQIKVTVWDSVYSESDPRLDVLDLKEEILEGQKTMMMPLYPYTFKDGSEMQTGIFTPTEKLEGLFNKLDAFVQIVYPPAENPFP